MANDCSLLGEQIENVCQDTQTDTAVVTTTDFANGRTNGRNGRNGEGSSLTQEMGAPTITD